MNELMTPQNLLILDCAVLLALTVAIFVGLKVARRLSALHAARDEWAAELKTFAERADAAEAGLERLRAALLAEAERREDKRRQDAATKPAPVKAPPPKTPATVLEPPRRTARTPIMDMQ